MSIFRYNIPISLSMRGSLMNSLLFCPICQAYLRPTDSSCSSCGRERLLAEIPLEPGKPLWSAYLPGSARGQPVVCDGLVLFAWGTSYAGGGLGALDRLTSKVCWTREVEHNPQTGPVLQGDRVYLAASGLGKSSLACWRLLDGERMWSESFPGFVSSLPLLGEKRIFISTNDGHLHAFDSLDGTPLRGWPQQLEPGKLWLLHYANRLLAVSENGGIYILDSYSHTGAPARAFSFGVKLTSPPALSKDTLYCGADGGQLLALNLKDGRPRVLAGGLKKIVAAPLCT
ncbi:MAG: PQQ-like beta-propeller repeat protein, partial [Anaerolineales bacterium]|nr:PQQ-like beta-propeller repeat protein [Anaerolineales bacterium]